MRCWPNKQRNWRLIELPLASQEGPLWPQFSQILKCVHHTTKGSGHWNCSTDRDYMLPHPHPTHPTLCSSVLTWICHSAERHNFLPLPWKFPTANSTVSLKDTWFYNLCSFLQTLLSRPVCSLILLSTPRTSHAQCDSWFCSASGLGAD